ncbi:thiol reductant ABC exporter subunit CydD [Alcaligenes pakistanensis]|uniref:Thiol reductant ABC exporter subunit CydD n=1 Tax=Alcaligenes pakistanensis TaxID=1482717 RepID=A0A8H9IJS7_9BURK|nr:thiol reductant ABC exporter subunit CydD [Alcaligenes pakistanensis]GHC49377.1 thiol reductant ABC exporter subunit CydD [Alcaligenes pakistanensis]
MTPQSPTAQQWLEQFSSRARTALRASMLAPVLAGALLIPQAWLLAQIVQAIVVDGLPWTGQLFSILMVAALLLLRAAISALGERRAQKVSEQLKQGLRSDLFSRLFRSTVPRLRASNSGELSTSLITQIEALDGFVTRYIPCMGAAALVPLALVLAVLPVDGIVALILLLSTPLIPLFMALVGWGAEAASREQQQTTLRLSGFFADRLRGIFTLSLMGRGQDELQRVELASQELRTRTMKVLRIAFLSSAVLEFFAALGVAGIAVYIGLGYLGYLGESFSGISLQQGLFCLLLAPEAYQPLRQLAANYHDRAAARAAAVEVDRLWSSLGQDLIPAAPTSAAVEAVFPNLPVLVLRHVRLPQLGGPGTLLDVPGLQLYIDQSYAVLGASGSGKTSLLESLIGLRPLTQGEILLRNSDTAGRLLTRHDGVVLISQQAFLAMGTIADGLRLAAPQASDEQLWQALEHACATEFVRALPEGLQTALGEGGFGLSGGQIQRLALARLFLTDPHVVLLDEPSSRLDAATRDQVMRNILRFCQGRCLVVATHDEQLAAMCSNQLRIAQGVLTA